MKMEHKVVPVVQTKVIDEAQGIVGAYVSVTGVVDSVKDRIIPGAYQSTLAQRTPKGVWSHDWDTPVSKTLQAEELLPGDERLPRKTRNGEEWPTAAGALYVETQFNLKTQRGREAFEDVVFFGDEQEWSIGYNVPPGTAKFDAKTGVRELSYVDLYEYSPVLFGAMDLTSTAGVKDAQEQFRQAREAGTLHVDQVVEEERDEKGTEPVAQGASPAAEDVTPVAQGFVDASQAQTVTTPQDPIHTTEANPPTGTGTQAGVALEPRPDPNALVVEDPSAAAPKTAEFVVSLSEAGKAATAALRDWFSAEMAKPDHDAGALIEELTKRQSAIVEDKANVSVTAVEVKAEVILTGSYEERQAAVRKGLRPALADLVDLDATDEWGYPTTFVTTEATFANRVVAAVYDLTDYSARYFEAGYTFGPDGATLKTPREVRVEAAVVAKGAARAAHFAKAIAATRGQEEETVTIGKAVVQSDAQVAPETAEPDEETTTGTGEDTGTPESKSIEEGMVTLSPADLLMLDRLKLAV